MMRFRGFAILLGGCSLAVLAGPAFAQQADPQDPATQSTAAQSPSTSAAPPASTTDSDIIVTA